MPLLVLRGAKGVGSTNKRNTCSPKCLLSKFIMRVGEPPHFSAHNTNKGGSKYNVSLSHKSLKPVIASF